jgi:hypothetical protein
MREEKGFPCATIALIVVLVGIAIFVVWMMLAPNCGDCSNPWSTWNTINKSLQGV